MTAGSAPVPGFDSNALFSGWAALGLAAAGHNPRDVRRGSGRSLAAYVRRIQRNERDIGEVERTAMVLRAAGLSPRASAGATWPRRSARRRRGDGSIGGYVSYTAFGVLALRAARQSAGADTIAWLAASHNADGGFGVARSPQSDADMTGAALQALAVTGRPGGRGGTAGGVLAARRTRTATAGSARWPGPARTPSPPPTPCRDWWPWARASGTVSRALGYIRRLQRGDGSVAYSRSSTQTPVWVTAQALLALPPRCAARGHGAAEARGRSPRTRRSPEGGDRARRQRRGGGPGGRAEKKQAPRAGRRRAATRAAGARAERSSPSGLGDDAGRPTGMTLDRAPADEADDGVSPWLVAGGWRPWWRCS